jgi:hypothetical protein
MNAKGKPLNFLAFQEFLPIEQKETGRCIWCGKVAPVNRAHIISKKLTKHAKCAPTLRFRVCQACNSLCGDLELWILRKTPLSFVRMMLYAGTNTAVGRSQFQSYFYSEVIGNWVVFQLDSASQSHSIGTQLILSSEKRTLLISQEPKENIEKVLKSIQASVRKETVNKDVRPSLPVDFAPRLLLLESDTSVAIARSETEIQQVLQTALLLHQKPEKGMYQCLNPKGSARQHFQWSRLNWARFCAKTALESLCLFEGGEVCLKPEFDRVRDFVINGTLAKGREIIFERTGPRSDGDVPMPVYLDLTEEQTAPKYITGILPQTDLGGHIVILYEIHGLVMASIVFSGFPPSVLILAGPNVHLKDVYQMIYDYDESEFHFLRLAYDNRSPAIPFSMPGKSFAELVETYRLRGTQPSDWRVV